LISDEPPATVPAVACRAVRLGYERNVVVPDLDLSVAPGELVALLGPSGSGKTTLLSAIAGFVPVLGGEIQIDGRVVSSARRHVAPENRSVGFVFQSHALWPHLSALDTVAYPYRRQGNSRADARIQAGKILERLGIGRLAGRRPAQLSGGEQQRVGLGRALARGARVLLFDEPTANLDAALRATLQAEIAEQRRASGAAALYATHDTAEALAVADRVALLRDGLLIQQGTPAEVYERPVDGWAARLTGPVSLLEVGLADVRDGHASVRVGCGMARGVVVDGAPGDGPPTLALVRPDWARLGGELTGRLDAVAYRGTHTDYQVATAAGIVRIRASGPPRLQPGATTGWSLERAWLLPAEPD